MRTMLVELRSSGCQTVFRGSTYKDSGEYVEFSAGGGSLVSSSGNASRTFAGAVILARHCPAVQGRRNEIALAVCGYLFRDQSPPTR